MEANDRFMFVNIREYLAQGDDEKVGEPELLRMLSDFSCPKNPDVEHFLKNSSIDFTRKNQSVTYLVLDMNDGALVEDMQYMGGGMVVFLEANDEERLLSFYQNNKFRQFDSRLTASDTKNQHELIQLLRLL